MIDSFTIFNNTSTNFISEFSTSIENYSGTVTAVATFGLVLVTLTYVIITRQAHTANVIDTIMRDYARQEIFDAMRKLRKYNDHFNDREKLFRAYHELRYTNENEFERLNDYRRLVSHHFLRIYYLRKTGAINDKLMRELSNKFKTIFYLEIIEPMEGGNNPNYNNNSFNYYRKLYPELIRDFPEIKEYELIK